MIPCLPEIKCSDSEKSEKQKLKDLALLHKTVLFCLLGVIVIFYFVSLSYPILYEKYNLPHNQSSPLLEKLTPQTIPESKYRVFCHDRDYKINEKTDYCYKVYREPSDFATAETTCRNDDAQLVSIISEEENDFVIELYKKEFESRTTNSSIWIGLEFSEHDNEWVWKDQLPVDFTNWIGGFPPNKTEVIPSMKTNVQILLEKESKTNPNGNKWMNVEQSKKAGFVCEKSPNN